MNRGFRLTNTHCFYKNGIKTTLENLETGSFAIGMGYLEENNLLETKRLVIGKKTELPAREVAFGQVTDISSEEEILTIKNEKKNLIYTIEIDSKTVITKKTDGKVTKIKFADIVEDDKLVAVGAPSENEHKIITAKIIHVIPGLSEEVSTTPTVKATPTP